MVSTTTTAALVGQGADQRQAAIRVIKVLLFSASVVPAVVSGAIAARLGRFQLGLFLILTAAVLLAQAGGDYLYFYLTRIRPEGEDSHAKIFAGWRPFFAGEGGLLRGRAVLLAGGLCLLVDLALGLWLTISHGWLVLVLALLGGAIALFFTPLMLRGLKEPVIFLAFGPLTMLGVVQVMTGELSPIALVASVPVGLLVAVVAHLKSAHFSLADGPGGQVVVRLRKGLLLAMSAAAYLSLVVAVIASALPAATLLGLLSLPLSISVLRVATRARSRLTDYLWAVVRSILVLIVTGALIAAGLLIDLHLSTGG